MEDETLMEAKTPKEFIEKVLPSRFNSNKAKGVDVTVQMSITGSNGGEWMVIIKDQKLEVKKGTHSTPTLMINMAEADYMDMVNGRLSGETAFMTGKLHFKGDLFLALRLREVGLL